MALILSQNGAQKGMIGAFIALALALSGAHAKEERRKAPPRATLWGSDHEAVCPADRQADFPRVQVAPPETRNEAVRLESRPPTPAVWVPGYWKWDAAMGQYVRVSGLWRNPPPGTQWFPGRWESTAQGWLWIPGHWAPPGQPDPVRAGYAPPPRRTERLPARPRPDSLWIPGVWKFKGRSFEWAPGHWEKPAHPNLVWADGQWAKIHTGYLFFPGYWDHPIKDRGFRDPYRPVSGAVSPGPGNKTPKAHKAGGTKKGKI